MPAARFTVLCDECIRIEWSDTARFVDEPSLFANRRPPARRVTIADAAAGAPPVDVRTSRVLLQFRPDGLPLGPTNLAAQVASPSATTRRIAFWRPGDRNANNLGGTLETLDGIRGPVPVGEGLLARDGWHVIDDSSGHLLVDGWVAARASRAVPGSNTDWYLFAYGDDFPAALRALARVAGRVPAPRRAALGSWYSRYWPHTSSDFRRIVADYHRHGFPLDVMVLDMDWHSASTHERWTGWSWNRTLLPDAEELLAELHAHGLQVALNLHPADGVHPDEDRYAAFMRAQGADPATGEHLRFDAGNRAYMTALFNEVLAPLEECERDETDAVRAPDRQFANSADRKSVPLGSPVARSADLPPCPAAAPQLPVGGVDFWWLDWQQDRFVPSMPGLTNLAWLNQLFFDHSARSGRRGISLSRWAGLGAGDHRHPLHFSGDAHTGWDMLAFQVPFTVAAGNAGCFFWSHDIGGHFGPRLEECTARWVWFGALSAAMRLHSARTAALDRRPWTYADPFAPAMRRAFELRTTLMPCLDAAAHECEDRALPLLRPMYLAHPREDRAYRVHGQYTIGPDLLAAPVTSPGIGPRHTAAAPVWFPPTSAWFNWFTHERFEPGAEACVAAAIDEVPLFAPAGVPIPMRTFSHRPATEPIDHLVIRLYPAGGGGGAECTRDLYEDDGDTTAYRAGQSRRTPITASWSSTDAGALHLQLAIGPATGDFDGAIRPRPVTLALGAVAALSSVSVNGRPAPADHDAAAGLFRIHAPATTVDQRITIHADIQPLAPSQQRDHDRAARNHRAAPLPADSAAIGLAARYAIGAWPETPAAAGVGRPDSIRFCDPFASIDPGTVRASLIERTGPAATPGNARILSTHDLDLTDSRAASIPLPPDELPDPPLGLRIARTARFNFSIDRNPHTFDVPAETRITPLTGFAVRGPFPWDWRTSIDQQAFDPELAPPKPDELAGWTPVIRGDKWPVDLRRTFSGDRSGERLAYAAAIIRSARAQTTTLHLDSGDRIEAWLNGAKVFSQDGPDSAAALTSSVPVNLPAGDSLLLIKTNDGGGGWGFAATLDGEHEVTSVT